METLMGERRDPDALLADVRRLWPDIVDATRARYIEAYERISGRRFDDWIGASA